MIIRKINDTDDRRQIGRIYEESWKYAYKGLVPQDYLDGIQADAWAKRIDDAGRYTLVATENSCTFGTAAYSASRFPQMNGYGEINSIYLLPEYIGKGYGRLLLQAAINGLSEIGFKNIFLWVLEDNHSARRFYERSGFMCSGVFNNDNIGGKNLREIQFCYVIIEPKKK
ncbi:MAG: GNAT family N-acetyltransferase [Planctomycetia bacterium]|nr:GNAT family N-acetyltransferase [Planctomycetia bacterium]